MPKPRKNQILLSDGLLAVCEESTETTEDCHTAWRTRVAVRMLLCSSTCCCDMGITYACSEAHRRAEAHLELGKLRHKQRDYRRAVQELQKATELNPDSKQAGFLLSGNAARRGRARYCTVEAPAPLRHIHAIIHGTVSDASAEQESNGLHDVLCQRQTSWLDASHGHQPCHGSPLVVVNLGPVWRRRGPSWACAR